MRKAKQISQPATQEQVETLHTWLRNTFHGGLTPEEYAKRQADEAVRLAVKEAIDGILKQHNFESLASRLTGDI